MVATGCSAALMCWSTIGPGRAAREPRAYLYRSACSITKSYDQWKRWQGICPDFAKAFALIQRLRSGLSVGFV
jgi:hypothetical protein